MKTWFVRNWKSREWSFNRKGASMKWQKLCLLLAGLLVAAALAPAAAQEGKEPPKKPPEGKPGEPGPEYREFFKKPSNAAEYWTALQFEIEVGRYDLAAAQLHALLDYKPADAELVKLADQVGMAAVLRLRNILKWFDDPKANRRAINDVDELIKRVTAAVQRVRGDPKRIQELIGGLLASPEEHDYALKELYRSGAVVVPYIFDAMRAAQPAERATLVDALRRLGPETLDPIVAGLDSNDANLQLDLLGVLRSRAAVTAAPNLWFLAASPQRPEEVRRKAAETLAYFLGTTVKRLPEAKVALTREAERYYNHEVKFPNPAAVAVWRWDGKRVVEGWPGAPTIPASRAEEYWGLKYAGQALALDPAYVPAQVVWLSLALEKAQQGAGLGQPLDRAAPAVSELLGSVSPALVSTVLERALRENRVPVILAAVRDLGARDDVAALRPLARGTPPLLRALYYPDRRVQIAAAEAVVRIPGSAASLVTGRVVQILQRALAADPGPPNPLIVPKVLVAYFSDDQATRVDAVVAAAGFEPVKVNTGRAVMLRLGQAADIDLVLLDEALPDPGLASLIAQLRADVNVGLVPVVLTAGPEREDAVRRYVERLPNLLVVPAVVVDDPKQLKALLQSRIAEPGGPRLPPAEMKGYAERAVEILAHLARGEPPGFDIRPAGAVILAALRAPSRLSPRGQTFAAEAAARLPGAEPQQVLADVVLDAKRPPAVRTAAAAQLVRHIQTHSPLLTAAHVRELTVLNNQPDLDPPVRNQVALVLGSLQPNARLSGERLLQFQPPPPGPPPKKE
jgi:CheY-like chemotaxis protein